jgi:hypothetical protein
MLLFGGAVFIMLATIIRAVTILTVFCPTLIYLCYSTNAVLLGRPRWCSQRQLVGLPRDVRCHRRNKPTYHPPVASTVGKGGWAWQSPQQEQ